ncbi:hypothetical protein [Ottowia thiooxydans]|uniref:hypothetical protein n=1 Tax=Ottowia thiooxydans TaxID=219182 RepID=UPI000407251A|nr:hypothetical protein [Ottowia thiooxydans]
MKAIFGLLGLLVALAIVVTVVKQQMGSASKALGQPASSAQGESVRMQSQQAQQQFRQAVEAAMVPARTASEEQ